MAPSSPSARTRLVPEDADLEDPNLQLLADSAAARQHNRGIDSAGAVARGRSLAGMQGPVLEAAGIASYRLPHHPPMDAVPLPDVLE